ncbi:MAG TPA: phosphodiester glycosidase family protein [Bacteroidales bacterium]|nr:phosphodiester glycosidase family protein [Bacteroidales bacterium]HPK30351.1 phosphodiester glycosidase family protein [Bacteroidales bacterium]
MRKIFNKIALSVLITLFSVTLSAQNTDSLTFVTAKAVANAEKNGIVFNNYLFEGNLFNSNQCISLLEVPSGYHFDVVAAPEGTLVWTSLLSMGAKAVAALNGSFFNMRPPFGGVTYTRVDGTIVAENNKDVSTPFWSRSIRQNGAIAILGGELYVLKADQLRNWEKYIFAEDVLTSGPILMVDGALEPQAPDKFNTTRHPRTAVGKRSDGTVVFVVVDGRFPEAAGVSTTELSLVMSWLGCRDALNLDGGGSSTMVFDGNIVNHPSDNKKFDHQGERVVANAIVVRDAD